MNEIEYRSCVKKLLRKHKFRLNEISSSFNTKRYEVVLKDNKPVIINGYGHYIRLIDYEPSKTNLQISFVEVRGVRIYFSERDRIKLKILSEEISERVRQYKRRLAVKHDFDVLENLTKGL